MNYITFRYSNIYDMNLCRWSGAGWSDDVMQKSIEYSERLQGFWSKFDDDVIVFLNRIKLIMPNDIIAYVVSPWPSITNFSDPLTIVQRDNLHAVISTLAHELSHISFSQPENKQIKNAIYTKISEKFPEISYPTKIHIAVNFLQKSIIKNVLPDSLEFIESEKKADENLYPGQSSAWHILDNELLSLDLLDPIESLMKLE